MNWLAVNFFGILNSTIEEMFDLGKGLIFFIFATKSTKIR